RNEGEIALSVPFDGSSFLEPSAFSGALFEIFSGKWQKMERREEGSLGSPSPQIHQVRRDQEGDIPSEPQRALSLRVRSRTVSQTSWIPMFFHFLHGALNAPQTKHRTLMHLGRSLMEDNLQSPTAEQAVNWKLATACGFPLEPAEKSWLHHELLGSLGYTFLASVGPLERTPHWILASDEWFRRVQNVDTALETLRKVREAAEELVSVLEKHGAQAFHVSSPLYYEAGSGLSQDVTLLLSRQGAYNKGDACPVQRLANADQGVFIVEHKESCMWCEQGGSQGGLSSFGRSSSKEAPVCACFRHLAIWGER
ncbi:unnamed protein product, partial [Durusdinium trenchii]